MNQLSIKLSLSAYNPDFQYKNAWTTSVFLGWICSAVLYYMYVWQDTTSEKHYSSCWMLKSFPNKRSRLFLTQTPPAVGPCTWTNVTTFAGAQNVRVYIFWSFETYVKYVRAHIFQFCILSRLAYTTSCSNWLMMT